MVSIKCNTCGNDVQVEDGTAVDTCDSCKAKQEKEARYEIYCNTYEQQLKLQRYIKSLERDIEELNDALRTADRGIRRIKKLIKINERDIRIYQKQLGALPPLPPFK